MNKRGQIYLIAALIIALLIFVLANKPNIVNAPFYDDDFKLISQNFNHESSKFLNTLIENRVTDAGHVKSRFLDFSKVFTEYSKSQNPSFGLIYLLSYDSKVYIGNFLDKEITSPRPIPGCYDFTTGVIRVGNEASLSTNLPSTTFENCFKEITFPENNQIELEVKGDKFTYEVDLIPDQSEVIVISRETVGKTGTDRKVFVEKQFIKGKKKPFDPARGDDEDDEDDEDDD